MVTLKVKLQQPVKNADNQMTVSSNIRLRWRRVLSGSTAIVSPAMALYVALSDSRRVVSVALSGSRRVVSVALSGSKRVVSVTLSDRHVVSVASSGDGGLQRLAKPRLRLSAAKGCSTCSHITP